MPFEPEIIDKLHCPRCNGMAEYRAKKRDSEKWILVYIVCPVCRLDRYSYTTTKKNLALHFRKKRLQRKLDTNPNKKRSRLARIEKLHQMEE